MLTSWSAEKAYFAFQSATLTFFDETPHYHFDPVPTLDSGDYGEFLEWNNRNERLLGFHFLPRDYESDNHNDMQDANDFGWFLDRIVALDANNKDISFNSEDAHKYDRPTQVKLPPKPNQYLFYADSFRYDMMDSDGDRVGTFRAENVRLGGYLGSNYNRSKLKLWDPCEENELDGPTKVVNNVVYCKGGILDPDLDPETACDRDREVFSRNTYFQAKEMEVNLNNSPAYSFCIKTGTSIFREGSATGDSNSDDFDEDIDVTMSTWSWEETPTENSGMQRARTIEFEFEGIVGNSLFRWSLKALYVTSNNQNVMKWDRDEEENDTDAERVKQDLQVPYEYDIFECERVKFDITGEFKQKN